MNIDSRYKHAYSTKLKSGKLVKILANQAFLLSIIKPSIATLSIATLSIATVSIMTLSIMTLSIVTNRIMTLSSTTESN